MAIVRKQFQYGEQQVTLETGGIARQADGAVLVRVGETVVLVTVVAQKGADSGRDFFPLTVNYQERTYAAGKIPGGYFKREGRPAEKEILVSRLIDRPLRPLFPEGFNNEVQVVATVLSLDNEIDSDIPAMIGASAAIAVAGIPFAGPMAAARVGYVDGVYILNPTVTQLKQSKLDLVVAGSEHAVLMVESEAQELSESVMLNAVLFGHEGMQAAIKAIKELAQEAGKQRWEWSAPVANTQVNTEVSQIIEADIQAAYQITDRYERRAKLSAAREKLYEKMRAAHPTDLDESAVGHALEQIETKIVREMVLTNGRRMDGRDTKTVRPISIELGILPRTHGSALFTRGETQALVVATLGTGRDAQVIDALMGDQKDTFMLHYNFPPYSTGETGQMGSPKRREIGHGRLAKRAIAAMLPTEAEFPYVLRVVSEITESNGSSSMASVCGTSLALMEAGVPIKAAVAGVAMGLIKEGERFAVLTDILGDEDHLGDMDFKVAGTLNGVTALQMDIKIEGVNKEVMEKALAQALEARIHILQIMNQALSAPKGQLSQYAPRIITMKIPRDKIRDVIGKGGVTIRSIIEETGANIDITDDGIVSIASVDLAAGDAARKEIERLTAEIEVGAIYEGPVVRIMEFGAFVTLMPGRDGLVHISQISNERVNDVNDVLKEGQIVKVKVLEIDKTGRIRLSMKDV